MGNKPEGKSEVSLQWLSSSSVFTFCLEETAFKITDKFVMNSLQTFFSHLPSFLDFSFLDFLMQH